MDQKQAYYEGFCAGYSAAFSAPDGSVSDEILGAFRRAIVVVAARKTCDNFQNFSEKLAHFCAQ